MTTKIRHAAGIVADVLDGYTPAGTEHMTLAEHIVKALDERGAFDADAELEAEIDELESDVKWLNHECDALGDLLVAASAAFDEHADDRGKDLVADEAWRRTAVAWAPLRVTATKS